MAREFADLSQASAARELGLSGRSKSTLSAWEAGTREPRLSYVARMSELYGVPVDLFTNPPASAHEVIERRLSTAVAMAEAEERLDWEAGQGPARAAGGAPNASHRKLSA